MTKYIGDIRDCFDSDDYPVFTLQDIKVLLGAKHINARYLKLLINHLIGRGEIKRIARGVYTFHDDIAMVGFAFRPFYYGMEDALSYRNLWTQATNPLVMTTLEVREGPRKFGEANYVVKRVKPALFFGFDFIKHYGMWLPVSDPEKTLIDLVYYGHYTEHGDLDALLDAVDKNKLSAYLERYSKSFGKGVYRHLNRQG